MNILWHSNTQVNTQSLTDFHGKVVTERPEDSDATVFVAGDYDKLGDLPKNSQIVEQLCTNLPFNLVTTSLGEVPFTCGAGVLYYDAMPQLGWSYPHRHKHSRILVYRVDSEWFESKDGACGQTAGAHHDVVLSRVNHVIKTSSPKINNFNYNFNCIESIFMDCPVAILPVKADNLQPDSVIIFSAQYDIPQDAKVAWTRPSLKLGKDYQVDGKSILMSLRFKPKSPDRDEFSVTLFHGAVFVIPSSVLDVYDYELVHSEATSKCVLHTFTNSYLDAVLIG